MHLRIFFAAKRKNRLYHWWTSANRLDCLAEPSLFFPYFDFTLIGVYMSTWIKYAAAEKVDTGR